MILLLLAELSELHGSFSDAWRLRFARASQADAPSLFSGLNESEWPLVEATYRLDHGELASSDLVWLRLDPASVVPDMNGVVMLGFGHMLNIADAERVSLLASLQSVLDEHGMVLHWPLPDRAYLGVPSSRALTSFTPAWDVLGEDLLEHFPGGETRDEASRSWRSVINDLQIALHDHPVNEARRRRGAHAINLMWPWRSSSAASVPKLNSRSMLMSPNDELKAMWDWADGDAMMRTDAAAASLDTDVLIDLRDVTRCASLERDWLDPSFEATKGKLNVQFGGTVFQIRPTDRFKFWIK